ncbi:hypothetical protein ZIOFF_005342 [Zingiber officinale]|uniref:Uncharacterized protein n=1 Tax=Zingiber officinale TaxID=94328 RepID=A0A8J5HMB1_ZINOF|nr:hypothetical protein ZIOFF_005342 [Zingiber officinale]
MAENSQQFGSRALTTRGVGEVQMVSNEQKEIKNSLIELTSLVKQLALNNTTQSSVVPNMQFPFKQSVVCSICSSQDHLSELCPNLHQDESLAAFSRAQFQQKYDPHSSTYNPGWRDHPNLKYGNLFYQQPSSNQQFSHNSSNFQQPQQGFQQQNQNFQHHYHPANQFQQSFQPSQQFQNQNQHYQFQNQNFQQGQNFIQQALPAPSRLSLTQGNSSNTSSSDAQQVRLEELMQQILQQQQSQQRTDSAIQNIERQIGQLASSLNQMQAQGSSQLPSQTTPNPKGNVSALTLRSGKRVAEFSSEETAVGKCPKIQQQSSSSEGIQTEQNVPTSGLTQSSIDPLNMEHSQGEGSLIPKFSSNFCPAEHFPAAIPDFSKPGNSGNQNSIQEATGPHIPLPFPQRKTQPRKDVEEERAKEFQELVNLFSKVEVNVPLLTMIKQIPKYAKFFKDLCVHKKKLKGNELISMGKNVSALLQPVPQKCEDPGVFTVPCIGPLQPTGVVIQLADRNQTHPNGVIEDVLVKHPREDHSILSLDISKELDNMDFFSVIDSDLPEVVQGDCLGEALSLGSPREEKSCVGDCLAEALPLGSPSVDQIQDELKPLPSHLKLKWLLIRCSCCSEVVELGNRICRNSEDSGIMKMAAYVSYVYRDLEVALSFRKRVEDAAKSVYDLNFIAFNVILIQSETE